MKRLAAAALLLILLTANSALAELKLPGLFSDHAVLQADKEIPVWGWADAGQTVEVAIGSNRATATAAADGKWMAKLPKLPASAAPVELTIAAGSDKVTLHDILIGEVWLGSGQSNMTFTMLKTSDAKPSIADAHQPDIRLFTVPKVPATQPVANVDGHWEICTPKTVAQFSAVLYHFGRDVHDQLKLPVGLIHSSWGGTPIQTWMPANAFAGGEAEIATHEQHIFNSFPRATAPAATRAAHAVQLHPMRLFNGMINPVIPYAIRGVIWYQGENNVHQNDVARYAGMMTSMVKTWRQKWDQGDWPFLYVQIAPFGKYPPTAGSLPEMWEQQTKALSMIPNSGMAAISDLGDAGNIHPKNKREVGRRLSLIALAKTYHIKGIDCDPPLFESASRDGNSIRIRFTGADGGLSSRDGQPLDFFEIAGADGKFVPAMAKIEGGDVLVNSAEISAPAAVRFGWSATAAPNLINKAGLPAVAFRAEVK